MEINLIPMIDVLMFLLVFLMMTTTFVWRSQLSVTLPEASSAEVVEQREWLEILISADGNFAVQGQALVDARPETLRSALLREGGDRRDQPLFITADGQAPHRAVVTAMDVAGQLGFSRLSISTREAEAAQTGETR